MLRYGMRYSTIKYWQNQAKNLLMMRGNIPFMSMRQRLRWDLDTMKPQEIASLAIQIAAVNPDWLKDIG